MAGTIVFISRRVLCNFILRDTLVLIVFVGGDGAVMKSYDPAAVFRNLRFMGDQENRDVFGYV